jgi:predicted MFS family arabinose efflux permease
LRQSLDTIGAVLGPLAAMVLMLVLADNFTKVFWIAVIPAFASFAVIVLWVTDPDRSATGAAVPSPLSLTGLARMGGAYWLVVGVAGVFTLARCSEAFLLLRAQSVGVPLAVVPLVLVIMNVTYALSAWPTGVLSDRFGRYNLLAGGFALLVAADLALAFANGIAVLGIGIALWGLHMGLTQGLLASLVADHAPERLRGTAFGMFNLVTGIATLLASVIAGALWDSVGPTGTFLAGAAFTAVALVGLPATKRDGFASAPSERQ